MQFVTVLPSVSLPNSYVESIYWYLHYTVWLTFIYFIHTFQTMHEYTTVSTWCPSGHCSRSAACLQEQKKTQNRNAKKGLALLKCKWKFIWINSRRKGSVLSLVPGHDTQNRPSWTHSTFSWITAIQCWQTRCQSAAG